MSRLTVLPGQPVALPPWKAAYPDDGSLSPDSDSWANLATSRRGATVTVTNDATAHVKGAWSELVGSMPQTVDAFTLRVGGTSTSGADSSRLYDVGVGAAGSEQVVVANIPGGFRPNTGTDLLLPIRVEAGQRVAIRSQGVVGGEAKTVEWDSPNSSQNLGTFRRRVTSPAPRTLVTMGADTATSSGTTLTAPGSNNTKAAWTQITAATPMPFRGLICCVTVAPTISTPANGYNLWDVGIGASGDERRVIANMHTITGNTESLSGAVFASAWTHIPAGTRVAARWQRAGTGYDLAVTVIGVPYA